MRYIVIDTMESRVLAFSLKPQLLACKDYLYVH